MKIELLINSEHPEAGAIQADISGELAAFNQRDHDLIITSRTASPPPNTLGVAEVYQFIIEHADDFAKLALVLRAVLDVVFAVLQKRNISPIQASKATKAPAKSQKSKSKQKSPKQQPVIIIKIGDATLSIPTTSSREHTFIVEVTRARTSAKKSAK